VYSKTLTLQWPAAKSHSRWAIGETISSELVSVKYFVRTKIIVTSPYGTETIELADQELFIVSTNDAERQLAIAKFHEMQDAMVAEGSTKRSKSKSPRRSRADKPELDGKMPPSPGVAMLANVSNTTGSGASGSKLPPSSFAPGRSSKSSSSRRPHTSAGPRDKPINFAGGAYGRGGTPHGQEGEASATAASGQSGHGSNGGSNTAAQKRHSEMLMRTTRPDSRGNPFHAFSSPVIGLSSREKKSSSKFAAGLGLGSGGNSSSKLSSSSFWSTVHSNGLGGNSSSSSSRSPRIQGAPSNSSTSTTASSSSISTNGSVDISSSEPSDHLREWEEELARIEIRSRKSSDLLGFSGKRKRSVGQPKVVVPDELPVADAS